MKYNNEERIGVLSVAKIFVENLNWIFREQPVNDFGVDAFVEIASSRYPFNSFIPTGRLIGVQIKSGKSFFKETTSDYFVYRGNKHHIDYWQNHSIPVIIILYDKKLNSAYWQVISESTIITTGKMFKVHIPKKNLLYSDSASGLKKIGAFRNKYEYNLWRLRTSVDIIKSVIREKHYLYIQFESSLSWDGYNVSLLITTEDGDCYAEIFHCSDGINHYFYLPETGSIAEGLKDILPWSDIYHNDEVFSDVVFTREVMKRIRDIGDPEIDKEVATLESQGACYKIACHLTGEDYFRLELYPNELASSFLKVNDFLSKEQQVEETLYL